jgi:1-acyl-sn-glycerol-3-phosphate acyltransferase
MFKFIGNTVLKTRGWKIVPQIPCKEVNRCVLICAPHTSNWDYILAMAIMDQLKVHIRYAIKKEHMKFPLGPVFKSLGGIGIDRSPKKNGEKRLSMVDTIAQLFEENEKLCMMIAAEGTRSLREEWKSGFYYIDQKANVPICLAYLDYEKREGGIGKVIYPSGDIEKDMKEIMEFYVSIKGKSPEKFSIDKRYVPNK